MSHVKTETSHYGARLIKSAATSALALSAVAGGVILSNGEAKALLCSFEGGGIRGCSYVDDRVFPPIITPIDPVPDFGFYRRYFDTNPVATDKQIKFISGPNRGQGNIEWKWIDVNGNLDWRIPPDPPSKDEWHVDVDFNPDFDTPNQPPSASIFKYIVKINKIPPQSEYDTYWFHDVSLGAIFGPSDGGASSVTKDIYTVVNHDKGDFLGSITCEAPAAGGSSCGPNVVLPNSLYDSLYIVDTATYGGRTIDAYQNVFRQQTHIPVPAPLPILGAAAAFGSVRKARKFSSQLKASFNP